MDKGIRVALHLQKESAHKNAGEYRIGFQS